MPEEGTAHSPKAIRIEDYDYPLPEQRIARFPLEQRDASRLLLYRAGQLSHTTFRNIAGHLPSGAVLVFNDTRVIHARLHFRLPNGSILEILCLEPLTPAEHQQNFSSSGPVRWRCLVGGNRKWKSGKIEKAIDGPEGRSIRLRATRLSRSNGAFDIRFEWDDPALAFGEALALAGIIPLPPYLKRSNVPDDEERYQTVYAREQGSVAAPTAGLHFTGEVLQDLKDKGIQILFVTLHVGAGTFRPVKTDTVGNHEMHEETVFINREAIASLKEALEAGRPVISVGTTSARLLESLYWHGAEVGSDRREPRTDEGGRGRKLEATVGSPAPTKEVGGGNPKLARKSPVLQRRRGEDGTEGLTIEPSNPETIEPSNHITIEPSTPPRLSVSQWQPYEQPSNLPAADALQAILGRLDAHDLDTLQGHTRLIIAPGYRFRIVSGMITNFHQPRSTLLLLIAALVGDRWRDAYQYALENDFRFLSYGDSCLLLPEG